MRRTTICALLLIAPMLTGCLTSRSRADLETICLALSKTRVTVTRSELAALSLETIRMIKTNLAVAREIGCIK